MDSDFKAFLAARPVAIVGASANREKYGNIVLRNLNGRGWEPLYPVNPKGGEIEGMTAYGSLGECPQRPELAVFLTPPKVTLGALEEAAAAGIPRVWFQPGAESEEAIARAEALGLEEVHDACIMVLAARETAP